MARNDFGFGQAPMGVVADADLRRRQNGMEAATQDFGFPDPQATNPVTPQPQAGRDVAPSPAAPGAAPPGFGGVVPPPPPTVQTTGIVPLPGGQQPINPGIVPGMGTATVLPPTGTVGSGPAQNFGFGGDQGMSYTGGSQGYYDSAPTDGVVPVEGGVQPTDPEILPQWQYSPEAWEQWRNDPANVSADGQIAPPPGFSTPDGRWDYAKWFEAQGRPDLAARVTERAARASETRDAVGRIDVSGAADRWQGRNADTDPEYRAMLTAVRDAELSRDQISALHNAGYMRGTPEYNEAVWQMVNGGGSAPPSTGGPTPPPTAGGPTPGDIITTPPTPGEDIPGGPRPPQPPVDPTNPGGPRPPSPPGRGDLPMPGGDEGTWISNLERYATGWANNPSRYDIPLVQQGLDAIDAALDRSRGQSTAALDENMAARGLIGSSIEVGERRGLEEELGRLRNERVFELGREMANTNAADRSAAFSSMFDAYGFGARRDDRAFDEADRDREFGLSERRTDEAGRLAYLDSIIRALGITDASELQALLEQFGFGESVGGGTGGGGTTQPPVRRR